MQIFVSKFKKILSYLSTKIKKRKLRKTWQIVLNQNLNIEERFNFIYQNNLWGSEESLSGPGSSLVLTKNLRSKLPKLIRSYKIKSLYDAPCGDLNWMKYLFPVLKIQYIGGDIVKKLIEDHKKNLEVRPKDLFILI